MMNNVIWRSYIQTYAKPGIYALVLVLLASCSPAPNTPETTMTPVAAAPTSLSPTALPPTTLPATPTKQPPTALPPTPTIAEAPTASVEPQAGTNVPASSGYLVYQRPDGSLWRTGEAGQPAIHLSDPTEPQALLPWAAAPDGKTIAIVSGTGLWYQFHENPTLALWLVGADGSNPRKIQDLLPPRGVDLTPGGDDAFNLVPALTTHQQLAWSPDGQLVAFVSAHQDQVDLYAATLDGTVTRLTDSARLEQGPLWSPDGALIAYRTTVGFGTGAGWGEIAAEVTARSGGAPVMIMDDRKLTVGTDAVALPDLLWISPTVLVAGIADSAVGKAELRTLDTSTHESTMIFDAPYSALEWNDTTRQLAIAGTSQSLMQANITGRKLAPGLFTWSPDAGVPTQIERAPVEALAWSPQGDALVYSFGGEDSGLRLWAIGAEGDLKPLANQPSSQLRWSLDGQRLATDTAIYSRSGQLLGDRSNEQPARLIGWAPQGLFYATPSDDNKQDLWLWDADTIPHQVDTQLTTAQLAGVVLVRP